MKINYKFLFLIPFVFYFFPSFALFFNENSYLTVLVILLPFFIALYLFSNKGHIISDFIYLYRKTPAKYFVFFYLWLIFSGLCAAILGYYSIVRFLFFLFIAGIFKFALLYFYPSVIISKYFNIKTIIKLFLIMYSVTLVWGIVEFFGITFNIPFIEVIENWISGIQVYEDFDRIRSFHIEPGNFAGFIAINLPIMFACCFSDYKIFNSKYLNFLLKISLLLLSYTCLFATKSPIFIVFSMIITVFCCVKVFLVINKKKKIILLSCISVLALSVMSIILFIIMNFSMPTFINRITSVVAILGNFDIEHLIQADASLATRVVNGYNHFLLFLKHPFIGIGFGNVGKLLINQLENSPIPLTFEMQEKLVTSMNSISAPANATFTILAQSGLLGLILYVLFVYKSIKFLNISSVFFTGIEKDFIIALSQSILIMFILSVIYNQPLLNETYMFALGLVPSIVIIANKKYNYAIKDTK